MAANREHQTKLLASNAIENVIEGKKLLSIQPKTKRPALQDVGNKFSNFNRPNIQKPTIQPAKPSEVKKTTEPKANEVVNKTFQKNTLPAQIIKPRTAEIPSSFSSKLLNIYDPDENTKNDPNAVTEYLGDIFSHLMKLEREYLIEKDFLENHKTTPTMRSILVNWIVELQINFKLCLETLYLSVGIVDRYLQTKRNVDRGTLQLVGVTAVMMAAKYEEIFLPQLSDYVYVCDDAFSKSQILGMERDIFKVLNFSLGRPSSIQFLRRYSKISRASFAQHNLGKYLLELALLDYNCCGILPSHQAAAACCLSQAILDEELDLNKVWTPTLVHYTTYKLKDFRSVILHFAYLLSNKETSKQQTVNQKYAAASFAKISTNPKLKGRVVTKLMIEAKKA